MAISAPTWVKAIGLLTYLSPIVALTATGWPAFAQDLEMVRYPFKWLFLSVFIIGGAYWLSRLFFTKTYLTDTEIVHRNFLLQWVRRPYSDISDVGVTGTNLVFQFNDGKVLKVDVGGSALPKVLGVVHERLAALKRV